jgi:hypothetical protein
MKCFGEVMPGGVAIHKEDGRTAHIACKLRRR